MIDVISHVISLCAEIAAMIMAAVAIRRVLISRASRLAESASANSALAKARFSSQAICPGSDSENMRSLDSGQESNSLRHLNYSGVSDSIESPNVEVSGGALPAGRVDIFR